MDTVRVKIENVERGSLAREWGNRRIVLDTLASDERGVFWYDVNGGRHRADADGMLTVFVATIHTQKHAKTPGRKGATHALTFAGQTVCPQGRRARELDVWESGTSLAAVTCSACRDALSLAPMPARRHGA